MTFISYCYEELDRDGKRVTRFGNCIKPIAINTPEDLQQAIKSIAISSVVHEFTVLFWYQFGGDSDV